MSFQITISPNRRAAARFVTHVRRAILKAYAEEKKASGLTQTAIARALDVHRSVINRELKGLKDMTLGRVAELAWAMGRVPSFELSKAAVAVGQNRSLESSTPHSSTIVVDKLSYAAANRAVPIPVERVKPSTNSSPTVLQPL